MTLSRGSSLALVLIAAACNSAQPALDAGTDAPRDQAVDPVHLEPTPDAWRWRRDYGPVADLNLKACVDAGPPPAASDAAPSLAVTPELLWKTQLTMEPDSSFGLVVDALGNPYVAMSSFGVFGLNKSGKVLWNIPIAGSGVDESDYIVADMMLAGDLLVYATTWGIVRAVTTSGKAKFATTLDGPFDPDSIYVVTNPVLGKGGAIHIGALDHTLYTISSQGAILYRTTVIGAASVNAVDELGNLYGTLDRANRVFSMSAGGVMRWIAGFTGIWPSVWLLTQSGVVVKLDAPGIQTDKMLNLDRACGATRWSTSIENAYCTVASIDGTLCCTNDVQYQTPKLFSISADGKQGWTAEIEGSTKGAAWWSGALLAADGVLYAFINNRASVPSVPPSQLRAFSSSSGKLLWSLPFPGLLFIDTALLSDGTLYVTAVGAQASYVMAIKTPSPGLAKGGWPKYRHDNQNTSNLTTPL
jgi:hypothetical protein